MLVAAILAQRMTEARFDPRAHHSLVLTLVAYPDATGGQNTSSAAATTCPQFLHV